MASSIRIESSSASRTVCLTCGDEGDTKLLIYCLKCRDSAVQQFLVASSQNSVLSLNKFLVGYEQLKWVRFSYCLEKFSHDDDNIDWICWDCTPRVAKVEQFRKSERISERKIRAFDV
ncbi:hypothetical protein K7X08_003022 [Anisodus acutangulus]|uniref:Uncharacterized protein n=1 Tax=Anisodus acutangulus TaxID=402998 RepID=A0A9Q1RHJ2_9SOLA|nr:hypothetical protein K7X08_003022 [Anisodus acutangulus]